jgi:aminopeptidase N
MLKPAGEFVEKGRNPTVTEGVIGRNPTVMEGVIGKKTSSVKTEPSITVGFLPLKAKDKFDIVTRLIILGDADGLKLLAELEKQYTDDAAKRYAYAARAGIPTKENKAKYWNDFVNNKEISENWIEAAFAVFNTPRHSDLTLPYLEKALAELPNLKRNRKIFFVNGWLGAFIGGQKSEQALNIVNEFLEKNPDLDRDLRLKILENADNLERAVKIRAKYGK